MVIEPYTGAAPPLPLSGQVFYDQFSTSEASSQPLAGSGSS